MLRRTALLAVFVASAGISTVVMSAPANAAGITSSNITSPATGAHYMITDVHPATTVTVSGTTSGGTAGDLIDVRCYESPGRWEPVVQSVPIDGAGSFSAPMPTDAPFGTCILRAVPHDYPGSSSVASFKGPKLTTEYNVSKKISGGPSTGVIYDYYVEYTDKFAMNDFHSATDGGLVSSRLDYTDGTSSNFLWNGSAGLLRNEGDARSFLRVDGHNAFGPYAAATLFLIAKSNPGMPALTYSVSRNAATGTTTIHETDPIVVCSTDTFPPTSVSCPQFKSAGIRLERTIVSDDGGRQVHISDVWRSTDGKAHTLSAHYDEGVEGWDYSTGAATPTLVGVKLPWVSNTYQTFTGDALLPGTAKVPATVYVRDDVTATDGDVNFPRGALTVDASPSEVHRGSFHGFTLRDEGIRVPAGGTRLVRHAFVIGTTQSEVNTKAAANERRINPWRPDTMIRTKGASAYAGNNIYNSTATNQSVGTHTHRGASATFYVKVQNDGTQADSFKLKGAGSPAGFTARYYAGTTNITSAVTSGTYTLTNVAPGAMRYVRLVITVQSSAAINALRSWLVIATSTHDTTRKDAVKAQVRVVAS